MARSLRAFAPALVALSLVAAACGGDGGAAGDGGGGADCNQDIRVGMALDIGGLGDKSFNDAANRGLQDAIADGLVCEENTEFIEADATGSNRDANVQALADGGYDLIIGVGFAFSPGINTIAPDYPEQFFAVVDGFATCGTACDLPNDDLTNVTDLTFKENEGSFLVGAAAALKCGCDTIGFLGGQTGPLIGKFEAGYVAGAKYINPDIEVLVEYIGDDTSAFNDPTKGQALSTKMYDQGAEIIYHAAGASGAGLFNAAVEAGKLAIGVDSDQYQLVSAEQQPLVLTSMLKRVDTAVYDVIAQVGEGSFEPGAQVFGLAEEGVDYSKSNTAELTEDIVARLDEIKQMIIDGEITVPEDPAEV
ncbi:MAG: BMP family ABC transporter substrate-binding protein [Actinomycetota bacterium]|jgi:basic membrane protein A|nr:MAG: BMP family ABC transporter substrate-binding protein [Actinomycetota bacterium]